MRAWELHFPLCCDLTAVPVLGALLGQTRGAPSTEKTMAVIPMAGERDPASSLCSLPQIGIKADKFQSGLLEKTEV